MIQESVDSDADRLCWMVGRATFTIVKSRSAIKMPASSTTRARHVRRATPSGTAALRGPVLAGREAGAVAPGARVLAVSSMGLP